MKLFTKSELKLFTKSQTWCIIKRVADSLDWGIKFKDLTPPKLRMEIYYRNLKKYGDELGPTIEWYRKQGYTWEQIIEKALRPGPGVN